MCLRLVAVERIDPLSGAVGEMVALVVRDLVPGSTQATRQVYYLLLKNDDAKYANVCLLADELDDLVPGPVSQRVEDLLTTRDL